MDKYIYDESNKLWYELKVIIISLVLFYQPKKKDLSVYGDSNTNAFEWIGRMNNIRACAVEIVNTEIIYA